MNFYHRPLSFTLLLIFVSIVAKAQFYGTYSWSHRYGTKKITILDSSRFIYSYKNCRGLNVGRGVYVLKDNVLFFNFKDTLVEGDIVSVKEGVIRYQISNISSNGFKLREGYGRAPTMQFTRQ